MPKNARLALIGFALPQWIGHAASDDNFSHPAAIDLRPVSPLKDRPSRLPMDRFNWASAGRVERPPRLHKFLNQPWRRQPQHVPARVMPGLV